MFRNLSTLAGLVLGIAGLVYVLWGLDFQQLWALWLGYRPRPLAWAVVVSLMSYVLLGFRLTLLSDGAITPRQGLAASLLGLGLNNVLPAKLGEVGKAVYARHASGLSLPRTLSLVFWERFFDLNALLLLALLASLMVRVHLAILPLAMAVTGVWGIVILLRYWPLGAEYLIRLTPGRYLKEFFREAHDHLQERVSLRLFVEVAVGTAGIWVLYTLQVVLILLLAADLSLTPAQAFTVFVVSAAGMALPSAPAAIGVFEAAIVVSLGWFGVDKSQAAGAAFVTHMVQYIPTTLGAVLVLLSAHLDPRRLVSGRASP